MGALQQGLKITLNEKKVKFKGPELNPFSIDNITCDMDGYYNGNGEYKGREVMANIDLDFKANLDSDINEIVLSDAEIE